MGASAADPFGMEDEMEMEDIKKDIRARIEKIANKDIPEEDGHLLGKPYYLEPRDLVYLFMELQEDYQIQVEEQELRNQSFTTVANIANIVYQHLTGSCFSHEVK